MHRGTESLISNIEKFPCLWNIRHENYNNRTIKDDAWEYINSQLHSDWYELSENKKKVKAADSKKKWTNIRDCYRKYLSKVKNLPPDSPELKKRYIYADLLTFLDPVFNRPRYSDGNIANNEDTQSSSIEEEEETEEQEFEDPLCETMIKPIIKREIEEEKQRIDVNTEVCDLIYETRRKANKRRQTKDDDDGDDDDDTKYLLSFRSYMKKMNTGDKLEFKIGMLILVKNIMGSPTSNYYNQNSKS
ncbi:uncharacterized protein LOC131845342 isoform X1 [Achroia grisella]|uniref:uncharacterized protein LOC131845342 isoform X1 n=1 Tax=Achroia grisella TaxID=688607 RepID=UPI0027D1EB00|nr:uncharacterized protein LOC131845342 isoform X1 [Achroia grisella]